MSLFLSYLDQHFERTCRVPLSILFLVSFYCALRLLFITMALSSCLSHPRVFVKADQGILILRPRYKLNMEKRLTVSLDSSSRLFHQNNMGVGTNLGLGWSFVGGCKFAGRLNTDRLSLQKKRSGICSCCKSFQSNFIVLVHPLILMMNTIWSFYYVLCKAVGTQFASCAFTLGTVAVLPFYTLMLFAPKSEITKKTMASCIPYVVLGLVYVYLLYHSWTPYTIHLMFASKYWLPELPGIAKMFSNEMTLASAWIHLLVVDLFAARHVYQDGLKNDVETRHSVSLCLLTCPVGILSHTITKALINQKRNRD